MTSMMNKSEFEIGFSTPKMPKNDTHEPILAEFLLFQHEGHDLHDL